MRIQHNITAMNAYRNYTNNNSALSKNLEKLSSGYKINRAGDDAAGLAISEKMRAQITGLDVAQKNAQDGISLVQTAEGALTEVHDMLNRMVELANQSANGTYEDGTDRTQLQKEVAQLKDEIDRIADSSNFNGINLLDGSLGGGAISSDGTTFLGAEVAKYTEANVTLEAITSTMTNTWAATKDTLIIDGQSLVIDWSKPDANKMLTTLKSLAGAADTEGTKTGAKALQDFLNAQMAEQGLKGSVEVTATGKGELKIESTLKSADSEITFAGADTSTANKSVFASLFGSDKGQSVINEAKKVYNGDSIKASASSSFQMTINGVSVNVELGTALTKGTTTMSQAATAIQTAIQQAVNDWNTAMGLTTGKDTSSGLTALTATDFTVTEKDGKFEITYSGDEDISFSFSDIGERDIAANLGLANGSSQAGGNGGLTLQIGDTSDSYNQLNVAIKDCHINSLGLNGIDIGSQNGAKAAVDVIKDAINYVSDVRGTLGATQNRLEHTINNLSVMEENIQNAESAIRDTDVADEMMAYTKNNILIQSAQAMLAQANQVPQGVLQLLQ